MMKTLHYNSHVLSHKQIGDTKTMTCKRDNRLGDQTRPMLFMVSDNSMFSTRTIGVFLPDIEN